VCAKGGCAKDINLGVYNCVYMALLNGKTVVVGGPQTIYVLELCENKYYIGATMAMNLNTCLRQHFRYGGNDWLHKWRPLRIHKLYRNTRAGTVDLNRITFEYMRKWGVDNVRGGSYSMIEFSLAESEQLKRDMRVVTIRTYGRGREVF